MPFLSYFYFMQSGSPKDWTNLYDYSLDRTLRISQIWTLMVVTGASLHPCSELQSARVSR